MAGVPPRYELVRRIDGLLAEFDAAGVLPLIGGAEAVPELIYLLQHHPDPVPGPEDTGKVDADASVLYFRCKLILLLEASRDPRAVKPLVQCYKTYRALEDLLLEVASSCGVSCPARYLVVQKPPELFAGLPVSVGERSPAHDLFRKQITGSPIQAGLESSAYQRCLLRNGPWIRTTIIKALANIVGAGAREFFATLLTQERDMFVRHATAIQLARMGDARGVEELERFLQFEVDSKEHHFSEFSQAAIDVLASLPGEEPKQILKRFRKKARWHKGDLSSYAGRKLGMSQFRSENCFIATAACGSADAPEVARLRRFREERLRPHRAGRAAIAVYELLSPPLAEFIRPRPWLRAGVRAVFLKPALLGLGFLQERQDGVESAVTD